MTSTAPTTETWRDYVDQLSPAQIDSLDYADRAPWTDPAPQTPYLLGVARLIVKQNTANRVGA